MHIFGQSEALNDQAGVVHRRHPFAEILAIQGKGGLRRLAIAFEKVVRDSYVAHPMRHPTTAEDKRRTKLVIECFRLMQGDLNWTSDRCISLLRDALNTRLSGEVWEPPTKHKTLWAPDASLVEVKEPGE